MRYGRHLHTLCGLLFLFALLSSAAQAGGMQVSSHAPRFPALVTLCASHLTETDVEDTGAGLLATCKACPTPHPVKPHQARDACATTQTLIHPLSGATAGQCRVRRLHVRRPAPFVYALHPRPPTRPSHA